MNIPGLPPLPFGVNVLIPIPPLVDDLINAFFSSGGKSQWGIYQNGAQVLTSDNVMSFGFKNDWSISTYPVEEGAFESYNKVNTPFDARIRLSTGGSEANRQALLDDVAAIAGDLELYDVVTPEVVYQSCNIASFDYHRTSNNGVGLIQIDIRLIEVRVTAMAEFSNTADASAQSQTNSGTVQPVPTTGTQQVALSRFSAAGSH